jgi:hypothetical protein
MHPVTAQHEPKQSLAGILLINKKTQSHVLADFQRVEAGGRTFQGGLSCFGALMAMEIGDVTSGETPR